MAGVIAASIAFVATSVGATAVASFVTSAFGEALINVALAVGLSIGVSLLRHQQSPVQRPSDSQQTIKQPLAARQRSYGTVRVSGVVWWMDTNAQVPATLYLGIAINSGLIDSYVSLHIDENEVDIDGSGNVTTAPYNSFTPTKILTHRGLDRESRFDDIFTVFGQDGVRGDGVAAILFEAINPSDVTTFTKTYPNGRPLIRATIKSTQVWDPRLVTQSRTDKTTWTFSGNVVLCLLNYMLASDGFGASYDRFANSISDWMAAADVCDELVPQVAGGNAVRYAVSGTYQLTDNPKDVVAKFLSVCDGRLWQKRDGSIGIAVGRFVTPTVTLTDDHIIGYNNMTFGQDNLVSVAGVRAEYMSPEHDYREHEAEPWPNAQTVLALSDTRVLQIDLLWAPNYSQARRLMKRAYLRSTADWRGTIKTNIAGLRALDERYINVSIGELGINRSFEIDQFTYDRPTGVCTIDIRSIDSSIDEWSLAEEGTQAAAESQFGIAGNFGKSGTAVNVLTEAAGQPGQLALVYAANSLSTPATPAGWNKLPNNSTTSPFFTAVFWRLLDGTEGNITVNGTTGLIMVQLWNGVNVPTFSTMAVAPDVYQEADTGSGASILSNGFTGPSPNQFLTLSRPMAAIAFDSCLADFDDLEFLKFEYSSGGTKIEFSGTLKFQFRTGSITGLVTVMVIPVGFIFPVAAGNFLIAMDQNGTSSANWIANRLTLEAGG